MKEEQKKVASSFSKHRLFMFWFIAVVFMMISMSVTNVLFTADGREGSYFDYLFISPTSNSEISINYYENNYLFSAFALLVAVVLRLFFFGKIKRSYIAKLEKIKRILSNFIPLFYINGKDSRNNFIRFGMQEAFKHGFLERKIEQGNYLDKVDLLGIFVGNYSPDSILSLRSSYIKESFINNHDYFEVFRIIEGYLKKNIDAVQNIPLSKYWAIGTSNSGYSNDSVKSFIKNVVPSEKNKTFLFTKSEAEANYKKLMPPSNKLSKKEERAINKDFIKQLTKGKTAPYDNFVYKMVVFSPLAIKEALQEIDQDARRFLKQRMRLGQTLKENILEFDSSIKTDNFIEIIKFLSFYKIINYFMGLPSGIVTARIENYSLSRILDDIDIFEKNITIRQIKPFINDKKGKYDDTFARAYMIFHHEYMHRSKNNNHIKSIFERFDGLRTLEVEQAPRLDLQIFKGSEEEKASHIKNNPIVSSWRDE